jgi:predicted phage terminase large subunit-like protein
LRGVPDPFARRIEQDEVARVAGVSAKTEAGPLLVPREASWLAEFQSELLGFRNARHDDPVDALARLLAWARERDRFEPDAETHGPMIVRAAQI